MKTFYCDACGSLVFFENVLCLTCGHQLAFLPDILDLSAVEPVPNERLRALSESALGREYRICANGRDHGVCNWLVPDDEESEYCVACRLNEIIPDLGVTGNHDRWHRLERAKRRAIYTALKLGLPIDSRAFNEGPPLRFRFLADARQGMQLLTGHLAGVITIDIAEADDDVREQRRVSLHEPLRTLLGHFRHELGHYFWDRLIAGTPALERFRALFGDERDDYSLGLYRHYSDGPPGDWAARHVSAYASMHPWEDWAETTAHYFHTIDTIETAAGFGMSLRPRHPSADSMTANPGEANRPNAGFDEIFAAWLPLTYALNSLNRGVGLPDVYPFVLSTLAIEKLRFVHEVISECADAGAANHSNAGVSAQCSEGLLRSA